MKAWYDDIDAATLQRIKTYSAFNDPESKNLMVQTMYEYKQEEIAELEAQIEKMKSDVMANIKWADKNCDNMWQKLVKMWNQWEIKEND